MDILTVKKFIKTIALKKKIKYIASQAGKTLIKFGYKIDGRKDCIWLRKHIEEVVIFKFTLTKDENKKLVK